MYFSIASTVGLLVLAYVSYGFLEYVFNTTYSRAPLVTYSWGDLLIRRSMSIKHLMQEAYNKYSKQGKVFRIEKDNYILPPTLLEQSRKLPTSILNSSAANEDSLSLAPSLGDDYWEVINFTRQYVTRSIPLMIPSILEEVHLTFKDNFPPKNTTHITSSSGQKLYPTPLYPTVLRSIGQIATKLFFGKKYSRDAAFIEHTAAYARGITIQAFLLRTLVPSALLPMVKRYILPYMPNATKAHLIRSLIANEVYECLEADEGELEANNEKGGTNFTLLPLMVKYVQKNPDYKGASREKILDGVSGRTLGLLFAAVDTTTISLTQIIYDVVGHPKAQYADVILSEANSVKEKHGNEWTAAALGELVHLDSFIKESQRLHPIALSLGNRKVMPEDGYTFTAAGGGGKDGSRSLHFKKGATLSTPLGPVHFDPDIYPNPLAFDGFRFVKDAVPSSQPSDRFMSFGHGRHACPGRHLALNILKLMTIEFLSRYEWEEIARPKDMELALAFVPDMRQTVDVSRKGEK